MNDLLNKRGVMKVIIWIIIILVIIGIVYVGYSYLDKEGPIGGSASTGEDNSGSSKVVAFGSEADKPPMPPE